MNTSLVSTFAPRKLQDKPSYNTYMEIQLIPFEEIPQLSNRDKAYYREDSSLKPFFKYNADLEAFAAAIQDKRTENIDRALLVEVLTEQYQHLDTTGKVAENIARLGASNAFTVVTAHQPSLFTGPLYYIYKIISCINLAEQLNERYAEQQFVPIFITGGEDHDFEEANHLHLFGKRLEWQSGEMGSVGQMKTEQIAPILEELKAILKDSDNSNKVYDIMHRAFTANALYADATIQMVHELFKDYGLVVLNMSNAKLKRAFIPHIKKEIFERPSKALIEATVNALEVAGFSGQATPRDINFFYLRPQMRERIVYEAGMYRVLNTDFAFTAAEMEAEIEQYPERFSPNVVMRPLYQEAILPNLAYIGGGGELAYWLERKSQFEHFGVNFPMLIRRNSALWVDAGTYKRINKLDFSVKDMFQSEHWLVKEFVNKQAEEALTLEEQKRALEVIFEGIAERTALIDQTLVKTVWAEHAKQLKSIENLEGRIHRAEKQKHDTALKQIASLKEKLYPKNDGLQERYDNFMGFYLRYGQEFFDVLKEHLDPLKKGFVVIIDK